MRVMLDTNVLISAFVFDSPTIGRVIRDPMDYPVVYSALLGSVDVLVTGDKDFGGLGLESPVVVTPAGYVEEYL